MKQRTNDKESTPDPPQHGTILTSEQIGPKRHMTREGFLYCLDVPIARTGWMMYGPRETPIAPGPGQAYTMIGRDAGVLFADTCILSFNGMPVVNDHPPIGLVDARSWRNVAVGTVHNVRRGTGADSDVLLADLLITDAVTIAAVQAGKREVSAGYDADYEEIGPGLGQQLNIIGNHIALVERGRCGPRCAIGDHLPTPPKGKPIMATAQTSKPRRRAVVSDTLRKLMLDSGMQAMEAVLDAPDPGDDDGDDDTTGTTNDRQHVHVHLHQGGAKAATKDADPDVTPATVDAKDDPNEKRFQKIEKTLDAIMDAIKPKDPALDATHGAKDPVATGDDAQPGGAKDPVATTDSAALETSFKATLADAEVLVPGFRMPAFDATAKREVTIDSMCSLRRKALDTFYSTADGKVIVDTVSGDATFDMAKATCVDVATMFRASAALKKSANNRSATGDSFVAPVPVVKPKTPPLTIAQINELHRKQYPH